MFELEPIVFVWRKEVDCLRAWHKHNAASGGEPKGFAPEDSEACASDERARFTRQEISPICSCGRKLDGVWSRVDSVILCLSVGTRGSERANCLRCARS